MVDQSRTTITVEADKASNNNRSGQMVQIAQNEFLDMPGRWSHVMGRSKVPSIGELHLQ